MTINITLFVLKLYNANFRRADQHAGSLFQEVELVLLQLLCLPTKKDEFSLEQSIMVYVLEK